MLLHQRKSLYATNSARLLLRVSSPVHVLFTDLVSPFLASMDPRWFEAFRYFKNLPNYSFVFACTISAQNVCQKWTLSPFRWSIQDSNKLWSFLPTRYHPFSFKIFVRNHFSTGWANLICSFDAVGETHTHSIVLMEHSTSKCHLTSCKSRHSSFLARNANENPSSETSRPLATSSLAQPLGDLNNGRVAA